MDINNESFPLIPLSMTIIIRTLHSMTDARKSNDKSGKLQINYTCVMLIHQLRSTDLKIYIYISIYIPICVYIYIYIYEFGNRRGRGCKYGCVRGCGHECNY